jgi:hypothetical protein
MPGQVTRHDSPLILQLVQNREQQQAAEAQKNPEGPHRDRRFFAEQPADGADLELVVEWVGVFVRVFWLALFFGGFLFVWVFVLKMAGF